MRIQYCRWEGETISSLHLEEYVFQQIENSFRMGEILPGDFDWNVDMPREKIGFTARGAQRPALECPLQLVGSVATAPQTWLWAWANTASNLPNSLSKPFAN